MFINSCKRNCEGIRGLNNRASQAGLSILLVLVIAIASLGAGPGSAQDYLQWEHRSMLYSGTARIDGQTADTISWTDENGTALGIWLPIDYFQTDWSAGTVNWSNDIVDSTGYGHLLGPNVFSLGLKLACYGAGDSAAVDSGYFHIYDEVGGGPYLNASGGSTFMDDGAIPTALQKWRFDAISDTSVWSTIPLQILRGRGKICFIVDQSTIADSSGVTASLWKGRL